MFREQKCLYGPSHIDKQTRNWIINDYYNGNHGPRIPSKFMKFNRWIGCFIFGHQMKNHMGGAWIITYKDPVCARCYRCGREK